MVVTFIWPIESQGKSVFGNNDKMTGKKPELKANIHRWLSSCGNNHKNYCKIPSEGVRRSDTFPPNFGFE